MIITINENNVSQYNALFAKAYQALKAAGKLRPGMENSEGRFLSIDDYFAHMADLLTLDVTYMMLPLDENPFVINANTRAISAPKIVTLQNDQIAETIIFTIDRYFDYMDLNNASVWVQWTAPGPNGILREGATAIEMKDISSIPGKIRLGWPLDSEVTAESGTVKYSVRFWNKGYVKDNNGQDTEKVVYSFNTLTSSFTVSPSLQPELNDDVNVNAPVGDNIFKQAIRNSVITGEGVAIPVEPLFANPGLNLPKTASLHEDALELKAQAIVGDTGHIEYEWYYKPAVDMPAEGFNANTYYPFNDIEVNNEDGTTTVVSGFKSLGGSVEESYEEVTNLTALVPGEQYYVAASDTSTGFTAYTGTTVPTSEKLYERYTTYTVPSGDVKVTGNYQVRATNFIAPNTSKTVPSETCSLISPDDIVFATDLPTSVILKNATVDLKASLAKQTNNNTQISYEWKKGTDSDVIDESIGDAHNSPVYTVASPGYYQVTAAALLNRETKTAASQTCKVTFAPEIPTMDYSDAAKELIDEGDSIPTFSGSTATLEVVVGDLVPEAYIGYDEKLFSDAGLTYTWTVQSQDGSERVLQPDDVASGFVNELGKDTLVVNTPDTQVIYTFVCYVSNTLNGETVTSTRDKSLAFYVK